MTSAENKVSNTEHNNLGTLGRALWRAKGWILGLSAGAGVATFIALSMLRPLYTSEARILIENDVLPFTGTTDNSRDQRQAPDKEAVQSQVQVLTSRDLALHVTQELDLVNNAEFAKDADTFLARLLNRLHLGSSDKSKEGKAADAFQDRLSVFPLTKSSVVAVTYASGDPNLAAKAANALADAYIAWQRDAKLAQTKDATTWLSAQIVELRKKVSESEAAVEKLRSSDGLSEGTNNVTLSAQQLSELNSQLIFAKAQRSEAEARARLIRELLEEKADIDATPELLKSELIGRLIEQRAQLQRQLAELSATLLPSHPRIQQLSSELDDVRMQVREEADKIVQGLENEAAIAGARESSLRGSLKEVRSQASGQSDAEIQLRALEREAKANRDLLESYLARYRDASAHHDMSAVPGNAAIVSRAHASSKPSFPKRGPISALVGAATALLALAFVVWRALIGGAAWTRPTTADAQLQTDREPHQSSFAARPRGRARRGRSTRPNPVQTEEETVGPIDPPNGDRPHATLTEGLGEAWKSEAAEARVESLFQRMRKALPTNSGGTPRGASRRQSTPPDLAPDLAPANDLRSYLHRKAPLQSAARALPPRRKEQPRQKVRTAVGPVLKSIDPLLKHIGAPVSGDAPRAVLLVPISASLDATQETIEIARALAREERTILVDLTRGPAAVSGLLGLPRAPGFTELFAGRAGFEDVLLADPETSLQVIPAGNPHVKADGEQEGAGRIIQALSQVYERLVLHIDRQTLKKIEPALHERLQLVVAVGASSDGLKQDEPLIGELTAFGCPVVRYEQSSGEERPRRSGFFGRAATV